MGQEKLTIDEFNELRNYERWCYDTMNRASISPKMLTILLDHYELLRYSSTFEDYTKTLNETRNKRDQVKAKLTIALLEIKMRKKYESFLRSCINSGESLRDAEDFDWFCKKYEHDRNIF